VSEREVVLCAMLALVLCPGFPLLVWWLGRALKRAYEDGFRDGYGSARWDMGKRRER